MDALWADLDRMVDRIVVQLREQIPHYAGLAEEDVRPRVTAQASIALTCLREPRLPTEDELAIAAAIVEARARQGLPLEGMLAAYRISMWEAWRYALETAVRLGLGPDVMLEAAHMLWRLHDGLGFTAAIAHRRADLDIARRDQHRRDEFLRRLLFGALPAAELRTHAPAYGLVPDRQYRAVRARATGTALHEVERALSLSGRQNGSGGLIGYVEGDLAGVLPRRPDLGDLAATVGVGPAAYLSDMEPSFSLASRALETAVAAGRTGVFTLEELPLPAMIVSEAYLGERLLDRYVRPLESAGTFGCEVLRTVREYLTRGMRLEETARALFVHPNTLRHRLARFEGATGANLRRTEDVVLVWWALQRRMLDGP